MAKRNGKGKGKGSEIGEKSIGESKKAASSSKILVQTYAGRHGIEFYSIDLETEKVMKLGMECLGKEAIMSSLVPFGSFIYLIGSEHSRRSSLYKADFEKQNESGFLHETGISYIQIQDGTIAKWMAGPAPPVKPPRMWFPDSCLLFEKIYVFTCGANKAQVFDPKLNQWSLISPPRGRNNFDIYKPVLVDHSNDRLLVFFLPPRPHSHSHSLSLSLSHSLSLYAYNPTSPPHARWHLLLPQFHTSSFLFAVDSGVIFSFDPDLSNNRIFTAFDVDSEHALHLKFTSPLDDGLRFFRSDEFSALLHLGNHTLCLLASTLDTSCTPNETLVFAIHFKIHRTTPTHALITPSPAKFYSLRHLRRPVQYSAF